MPQIDKLTFFDQVIWFFFVWFALIFLVFIFLFLFLRMRVVYFFLFNCLLNSILFYFIYIQFCYINLILWLLNSYSFKFLKQSLKFKLLSNHWGQGVALSPYPPIVHDEWKMCHTVSCAPGRVSLDCLCLGRT